MTVNFNPPASAEAATIVLGDETSLTGPRPSAAHDPAIPLGSLLADRYELVELVGEGGMSRVYRVLDRRAPPTSTDVYLAIKVLTRPVEPHEAFPALQREIAKLSTLSHPNIVRFLDCDRDGSLVFISMEYLNGDSLYARLHSAMPVDGVAVIRRVADALVYAHRHDVVHGDLKPGNVILEGGLVKVIDFTIASMLSRPKTALERRETAQSRASVAVTPRYASPQLMARQSPTPADDVYSLACMAYEVLTGIHPFETGADSPTLAYPPPSRPGLTTSQYRAIVDALSLERHSRTASVEEFIAQFDAPERLPARSNVFKLIAVAVAAVSIVAGWWYVRASKQPMSYPSPLAPVGATHRDVPGRMVRDCPDCAPMMIVPAGNFEQGAPPGDADASAAEKPTHHVSIPAPFALSVDDVTVGEFGRFVAETHRDMNGCEVYDGNWHRKATAGWSDPGFGQTDTHPVTCVSWNDAVAYAAWVSGRTGQTYRLPSASEWEYAARAGVASTRPWVTSETGACEQANVADQSAVRHYPGWKVFPCEDGYVNTAPVGSFPANGFGVYDMLGNVFQWTQDCWQADYAQAPSDGTAQSAGDCAQHELRGGSWFSSPKLVSATHRNRFPADYRTSSVGFRLVRAVEP